MPTVFQRTAARNDLVEHFVYLAENAGLNVAERFLANAEASFNDLAEQPKMGAQLKLKNPAMSGIRKWRVKDRSMSSKLSPHPNHKIGLSEIGFWFEVTADSRSGLSVTAPIGAQFRVWPDHRRGLRARARVYSS